MPDAKVRRILKTFMQFQDEEIEIVTRFREQVAKKEGYKQTLLRLMREATK